MNSPPSTPMTSPLMNSVPSPDSARIVFATSWGVVMRPVGWAADIGAKRVELYTEPFARAFEHGDAQARESFATYCRAAELAHTLGLGVNAGHDLDLENLVIFKGLPHLDEVSIGHALVSHALFVGLAQSVREYLDVLAL